MTVQEILGALQVLPSGFRAVLDLSTTDLHVLANPLGIFDLFEFRSVLNNVVRFERIYRPESKHSSLRRAAINIRGVRGFGLVPDLTLNVSPRLTDSSINYPQETIVRDRAALEVPISLYIWVASIVYSFDFEFRSRYIIRLTDDCYVPSITLQMFKKVRRSYCGIFGLTPRVSLVQANALLESFPEHKNTLLDPNYLLTENGISDFISLCNFLGTSAPDYVSMTDAKSIKGVSFDSYLSTTFCALNINIEHNIAMLLPDSEFKRLIVPAVHIADALMINLRCFRSSGEHFVPTGPRFYNLSYSDSELCCQLVRRSLGIDTNSVDDEGVTKAPPVAEKNSVLNTHKEDSPSSQLPRRNYSRPPMNTGTRKRNVQNKSSSGAQDSKSVTSDSKFMKFLNELYENWLLGRKVSFA